MASNLDLSLAKIKTLKKRGYNLKSAQLIILSLYQSIESGDFKWEDLKSSKNEIDLILFDLLINEFLVLFKKYQEKEISIDEMEYHFDLLNTAILRSQISFKDLYPFEAQDFFKFRQYFSAKHKQQP